MNPQVVVIFGLISSIFCSLDSVYIQTKVLIETTTCLNSDYYGDLKLTMYLSSIISCARYCSHTNDCRRLLFDTNSNLCTLFESGENCLSDTTADGKLCFRQKGVCQSGNCTRCPIGYFGNQCQNIIKDCKHGKDEGVVPEKKMISYIRPANNGHIILVKCSFQYGLTIVQHRNKACEELDFSRSWNEYVNGFGNAIGEYWLGLQHIYDILENRNSAKVSILLVSSDIYLSRYDMVLGNSTDNYTVFLNYEGHYNNPIRDSLTNGSSYSISGRPFSTYDRDFSTSNCPARFNGGWWYLEDPVCSQANLNGKRTGDFEATLHWQDDPENKTNFYEIQMRI